EFCLTEGGGATLSNGRVTALTVSTTEKLPRRVRLVLNGTSGHGSIPRIDNALVHLSGAVSRLGAWETPLKLNDTTRTYFERLAAMSPRDMAARYNGTTASGRPPEIQRYLAE